MCRPDDAQRESCLTERGHEFGQTMRCSGGGPADPGGGLWPSPRGLVSRPVTPPYADTGIEMSRLHRRPSVRFVAKVTASANRSQLPLTRSRTEVVFMRRFLFALLSVTAVLVAGCGSGDDAASEGAAVDPAEESTTSTSAAPVETAPPTTDTIPPDATELPDLQITFVEFGNDGFVVITNVGDEPALLDGIHFCQFPTYVDLGPLVGRELAPNESVEIAGTEVGGLGIAGGEAALYSAPDFSNPDAIIAYVQWGTGGARSDVAAAAGIWPQGASVTPDPQFNSIELFGDPADVEAWS